MLDKTEEMVREDILGLNTPAMFTESDPYRTVGWKRVDVRIENADGEVIFEMEDAEFPEGFSQQACDIIASKYFRVIDGVRETSYRQVVERMTEFWTDALLDEGMLETPDEARIFTDDVAYMLLHQIMAPNSPQWFNTGVPGSGNGLWILDDQQGFSVAGPGDKRAQTSACFITSIEDRLMGPNSITDHYVTETRLFRGGSGTGTNFSAIRSEGERLSGGGTSSGVMSFLDGLDRNAGAIKSGGTTRRAAKMVILDVDHPEIMGFIGWKAREERKAKALIEAGYDGSMGGEAYSTVSGQNSNNSVRLTGEFMAKVKALKDNPDATMTLKGRMDDSVNRKVRVADVWDAIAQAAWECADPGVQFDDRYNEWHTCPNAGRINATNPCSEYAFIDNSACNLASINVLKFWDGASFDFDGFRRAVRLSQLVLEASIAWGAFPTVEILGNSYNYRPTGLGLTNLAALLLAMEIPYDSGEGRLVASALAAIMCGESYGASHDMAWRLGAFNGYETNADEMVGVVGRHHREARRLSLRLPDGWDDAVRFSWGWFDCDFREGGVGPMIGFRNAQTTVMAPTGTISFAMDCASTGIEPFYSHVTYKKCSDGSYMEIVNPLYDESLPANVLATAGEISPEGHLKMMAAMQPYLSGSISKTVNMPNSATVEDIQDVYLMAYDLGLKSVSIYRDGSKWAQPLTTSKDGEKADGDKPAPVALRRDKPDGIRFSRTHAAQIGGVELYITVGYYSDGRMCELFVSSDRDGTVIKGLLASLSKAVSHMLQYGVDPRDISRMLRGEKYEPSGVVMRHPYIKMADSISDLISKVIDVECGDYSRCQVDPYAQADGDGAGGDAPVRVYGERCPACGSDNMVQSGTCRTCADCGTTTGCA